MDSPASLAIRILASASIDVSLAMLCGLLLARWWLRGTSIPLPSTYPSAALLAAGGVLQLFCLAATFTGETSPAALCRALPAIAATHAGAVLTMALAASACLLLLAVFKGYRAQAAALLACLVFRAGVGHAATENVFSLPHAMQCLHLAAMSVWSGSVTMAGLVVLPRLAGAPAEALGGFMGALSRAATFALAIVLLSGLYRGYTGLDGNYGALLHTAWGITLTIKLVAVATAMLLGGLNRLHLARSPGWLPEHRRRTALTLRAEAFAMLAILLLSSTLANLPPPGD